LGLRNGTGRIIIYARDSPLGFYYNRGSVDRGTSNLHFFVLEENAEVSINRKIGQLAVKSLRKMVKAPTPAASEWNDWVLSLQIGRTWQEPLKSLKEKRPLKIAEIGNLITPKP